MGLFSRPPLLARLLALFALALAAPAGAGEARVAVAANFETAAQALGRAFEARSADRVEFSFGATGALYAQIVNGAPFDAFFAADIERPRKLVERDLTTDDGRFTYALGRLVLWSKQSGLVDGEGAVLRGDGFKHLAIANPKLAPYGRAAQQTLAHMGLWQALQPRLVRGQSIAQAHRYVASGNAELGFVALSQVTRPDLPEVGSRWRVPAELYQPIEQQAVLLSDAPAATAFAAFSRSDIGRRIIRAHGYGLPDKTR